MVEPADFGTADGFRAAAAVANRRRSRALGAAAGVVGMVLFLSGSAVVSHNAGDGGTDRLRPAATAEPPPVRLRPVPSATPTPSSGPTAAGRTTPSPGAPTRPTGVPAAPGGPGSVPTAPVPPAEPGSGIPAGPDDPGAGPGTTATQAPPPGKGSTRPEQSTTLAPTIQDACDGVSAWCGDVDATKAQARSWTFAFTFCPRSPAENSATFTHDIEVQYEIVQGEDVRWSSYDDHAPVMQRHKLTAEPGNCLLWETTWFGRDATGAVLTPGTYEVVARVHTDPVDTRLHRQTFTIG